jgi:chromosome segregation ATPase
MAQEPKEGVVGRVLRRAGFVSAARTRELAEARVRAEEHARELKRALEKARADAQELKDRGRERAEKAQQERAELEAKYQARLAKAEQRAEQEAARLRDRDGERAARVEDLRHKIADVQQKMAWAEKSTQLGREHLMAIEVKLDIVEGAIKVLDQRTRAALAARDGRDAPRPPGRVP